MAAWQEPPQAAAAPTRPRRLSRRPSMGLEFCGRPAMRDTGCRAVLARTLLLAQLLPAAPNWALPRPATFPCAFASIKEPLQGPRSPACASTSKPRAAAAAVRHSMLEEGPLLERLLDVETGKDGEGEEAALAPRSPLAPSEAPSQLSHLEYLLAEEQPMPAGRGDQGSGGCGTSGGVSGAAAAARCCRHRRRPARLPAAWLRVAHWREKDSGHADQTNYSQPQPGCLPPRVGPPPCRRLCTPAAPLLSLNMRPPVRQPTTHPHPFFHRSPTW